MRVDEITKAVGSVRDNKVLDLVQHRRKAPQSEMCDTPEKKIPCSKYVKPPYLAGMLYRYSLSCRLVSRLKNSYKKCCSIV